MTSFFLLAAPAAGGESSIPNYVLYGLAFIVVGALTGYLGSRIMPGRDDGGRAFPTAVGLVAGLVGGVAGLLLTRTRRACRATGSAPSSRSSPRCWRWPPTS
jgi:uncharacterized membrane protein YeaQ/YmgE (transglycosylase-associated protein family)